MDRKDEIIKLQMDVIQQMTESNLKRIADDLWGLPTLQAGGEPVVKQSDTKPGVSDSPKPQEVPEPEPEVVETMEDLKKELESYIGLEIVKHEVESLVNLVTIQKLRKKTISPWKTCRCTWCFPAIPAPAKP